IIDCARAQKLDSIGALEQETAWIFAREYGTPLLVIVHGIYPPSAPSMTDNAESGPKKWAPTKCTACHQFGHI
ncbi:hypothetical protein BKA70DRAFT_1030780, partial [Coprinopsis sp. MPI-PUGE-AT-0042]